MNIKKIKNKRILQKTDGVCAICGKKITNTAMTVDHYIPKALGGSNELTNMFPTCRKCNCTKGDMIIYPTKVYPYLRNMYMYELFKSYNQWVKEFAKDKTKREIIDKLVKNNGKLTIRRKKQQLINNRGLI